MHKQEGGGIRFPWLEALIEGLGGFRRKGAWFWCCVMVVDCGQRAYGGQCMVGG